MRVAVDATLWRRVEARKRKPAAYGWERLRLVETCEPVFTAEDAENAKETQAGVANSRNKGTTDKKKSGRLTTDTVLLQRRSVSLRQTAQNLAFSESWR